MESNIPTDKHDLMKIPEVRERKKKERATRASKLGRQFRGVDLDQEQVFQAPQAVPNVPV